MIHLSDHLRPRTHSRFLEQLRGRWRRSGLSTGLLTGFCVVTLVLAIGRLVNSYDTRNVYGTDQRQA